VFRIFWLLPADAAEFVGHPVIHVEDEFGDGVREAVDVTLGHGGVDVFDAGEGIGVSSFTAEEFG
jgi:hypothetical protein